MVVIVPSNPTPIVISHPLEICLKLLLTDIAGRLDLASVNSVQDRAGVISVSVAVGYPLTKALSPFLLSLTSISEIIEESRK